MPTVAELFALAVGHHQRGELRQAETFYRQVLQTDPHHVEAHHLLGLLALQARQPDAALALLRQTLKLNPHHVEARINMGNLHFMHKQFAEAGEWYRQALRLDPNHALAHYNLGNVYSQQKQMDQAAESFRQTLRLNPNHADALNNLGKIYGEHGQWDEAAKFLERAVALNPNHAEALNNLGNILKAQCRPADALRCFRKALALNPQQANAHANLGLTLAHLGQYAEADQCYQQALRIDPHHGPALGNRSLLRLLQGDFENGWQDYEQRQYRPGFKPRTFNQPRWDGSPLEGKTILVHAEQGFGDTIQFVRYLPLVQQRGGKVLLECPPALFGLLEGIAGMDQIVRAGETLPSFLVHIPLMSLPGLFGTTLATIPAPIPYLYADPRRIEYWGQVLGRSATFSGEPQATAKPPVAVGSPLNIGIAWQGTLPDQGVDRSLPLKHFEPLARVDGVRLVSLQVGRGTEQIKPLAGKISLLDLSDRLDKDGAFLDTAAVMKNLDLVVTVDTAVGHVAGALGVPVWLVLHAVPDWRWMLERADSPWYPKTRLFRQRHLNNWEEVFERIAREIRAFNPGSQDRSGSALA